MGVLVPEFDASSRCCPYPYGNAQQVHNLTWRNLSHLSDVGAARLKPSSSSSSVSTCVGSDASPLGSERSLSMSSCGSISVSPPAPLPMVKRCVEVAVDVVMPQAHSSRKQQRAPIEVEVEVVCNPSVPIHALQPRHAKLRNDIPSNTNIAFRSSEAISLALVTALDQLATSQGECVSGGACNCTRGHVRKTMSEVQSFGNMFSSEVSISLELVSGMEDASESTQTRCSSALGTCRGYLGRRRSPFFSASSNVFPLESTVSLAYSSDDDLSCWSIGSQSSLSTVFEFGESTSHASGSSVACEGSSSMGELDKSCGMTAR